MLKNLFRCSHKNKSLPVTRPRKDPEINRLRNTYVVCLKCGERFPYSFEEARVIAERRKADPIGDAWIDIPSHSAPSA